MRTRELDGRIALVTGGAKGIGRACCLRLAEAGAHVAVNYRSSEQQAQELARTIDEAGGRAMVVGADASSPDEVQRMVASVNDTLGPVELLVNNAGIFEIATHDQTTLEHWQRTLDNNLTSAYLTTWAVKGEMARRRFGRIVNVASIAGLRARPTSIAYSVSKAGLIALTRSLAAAVAEFDIRVNAVAPGLVDTEILRDVDPARLGQIVGDTPLGRMASPEEIADVVLFLLSERSSFMTGQTMVASGGRVMLP